ncbi:SDR family NAD(P)-dependent oxidoreductase [Rhodococcus opacus]|uniref:SDR family NAD(P)-dependent oxidoreductase n=1 Tax=Rhodococcus opacus TaxID=37919 RepID=UPI002952B9DE|nr:SDR family oxidoreductase [Rhodococcus opacus]MDV7087642.1 SDR family oxidoreductase [Rhodococcus opacus]
MNNTELFDLTDKVAVVTGAGGGLGLEFAITLAEAGANIVCVDLDLESARRTTTIVEGFGRKAHALPCDVADEEQVRSTIRDAHSRFGRIDILVNNAGIADPAPAPVGQYDSVNWHRVIDIDLHGVFYFCNETLPFMEQQGSGKIINIASMWGLVGGSSVFPIPAYNAAKGAVINLTREIGLEYATKNIQVNALCPGFYRTRVGPFDDREFLSAVTGITPMGRIAEAEEIRGPALFLASAASNFMTGQTLVTDGGALAQ